MVRRALVLGGGGFRGAYAAGVASVLCRKISSEKFFPRVLKFY